MKKHLPWIIAAIAFLGLVWPAAVAQVNVANNAAELSGKIIMLADGGTPRTVTNLFTFDRDPSAPFAVTSGSAKVANLDADLLDGLDSSALSSIGRYECGLRLSLTSGNPVTTADVTAATTVFITPIAGGVCSFYDGAASWATLANSEDSIALGADTANLPYDVFCFNSGGTMDCERLAWTNDTTRATALAVQNNIYVKSGTTTRRYIGTYRTTAAAGQTEDSYTKRLLFSYYHRVRRPLRRLETTSTWAYTTATIRQANGAAANQLTVVVGVAEVMFAARIDAVSRSDTGDIGRAVGFGEDSTTTFMAGQTRQGTGDWQSAANVYFPTSATINHYPAVGYHVYSWNEVSVATGNTTWAGQYAAGVATIQSGMSGSIED